MLAIIGIHGSYYYIFISITIGMLQSYPNITQIMEMAPNKMQGLLFHNISNEPNTSMMYWNILLIWI